jgi:hypothetical protein
LVARVPAEADRDRVPRFFFHLYDDCIVLDEEGSDLVDVGAARGEAIRSARSIMAEQIGHGQLNLGHRIEVEDANGDPVLTLTFGDAVTVQR